MNTAEQENETSDHSTNKISVKDFMAGRGSTRKLKTCMQIRWLHSERVDAPRAAVSPATTQICETAVPHMMLSCMILYKLPPCVRKCWFCAWTLDTGDVIQNENASHLSETDKLDKRTVILGGNEPAKLRLKYELIHQERTTREGNEGNVQTMAVVTEYAAILINNVNTMRAYLKIVPIKLYGPEESLKVHVSLMKAPP
ncbi:hypothetical protein EVAR_24645_1 [Eumeta japonica]|uniref:Uncharacterized protein n=1 Tax=Eumeta variegata TaxID=151549 RepID=A0A4C1V149_EUMVA|nr:hypothetical protein EVAR_24645_1 [Eumeta japonica]